MAERARAEQRGSSREGRGSQCRQAKNSMPQSVVRPIRTASNRTTMRARSSDWQNSPRKMAAQLLASLLASKVWTLLEEMVEVN